MEGNNITRQSTNTTEKLKLAKTNIDLEIFSNDGPKIDKLPKINLKPKVGTLRPVTKSKLSDYQKYQVNPEGKKDLDPEKKDKVDKWIKTGVDKLRKKA